MAMNKHMDDILSTYKFVFLLNLLSQRDKPDEARLHDALNDLLNERGDNRLNIYNFDFHQRLGGNNFGDIDEFLGMLEPELMNPDRQRFFIHSRDSNKTYMQAGVFRTNCLDCLDRTNFTQAKLSGVVMKKILDKIKTTHLKKNPHAPQSWDLPSEIGEIEQSLQRMWDENGDKLSNQYAGTQSNISGVLEDGKQSFAGGIFGKLKTGVQRYFVSNFSDPEK